MLICLQFPVHKTQYGERHGATRAAETEEPPARVEIAAETRAVNSIDLTTNEARCNGAHIGVQRRVQVLCPTCQLGACAPKPCE